MYLSREKQSTLVETKRENAHIAEMIPIIQTAIESGKLVEMKVTGDSMKPLLKDRVSSVRLTKPDNLKVGDIVLFLRYDGHYVLHRIIGIHNNVYDIVGDNQYVPDRNVPKEAIIAKVCRYSRDNVHWKKNDFTYQRLLPLVRTIRPFGRRIKRKMAFWKLKN